MAEAERPTRYARVKAILNTAAGGSAADYGGVGPFWELPLPELLELKVHGVRMIARPPRTTAARHTSAQAPAQLVLCAAARAGTGRRPRGR
jgi:hypothetical protein